jgi:transcriptional regulator with XRE-family HTH domain
MAEEIRGPDGMRRSLGRELRNARRARGLTQAALAARIGYSRGAVSMKDNGIYPQAQGILCATLT